MSGFCEFCAFSRPIRVGGKIQGLVGPAGGAVATRGSFVGGKSTDATTTRGNLAAMIKEVEEARRGIQSVADATWPALEKVHGPIRKEFKIPLDRRLV